MQITAYRILLFGWVFTMFLGCKSDDKDPPFDPTLANRQSTGTSSEDFLRDSDFKSVTLEIVYAEGFYPEPGTIDHLLNFMEERVNKSQGITVVERMIQPDISGNSYTINDIVAIETQHRTFYNDGTNLAVYVFFSNKKSSNDTPTRVTLGTAYRNTSAVIYKKTINDAAVSHGINIGLAERTTLNHEFGHLFGLVNLELDDIHQVHEDTQSSKHCMVEECLMYFETTGNRAAVTRMLLSRSTDRVLDQLCIEDLQAKGGK
jgi:hypothetical protein